MAQAAHPQRLGDAAWPEVESDVTLLVPVGATEQHGPHLPLDVDTVIATAVCAEVAVQLGAPAQVAPAIAFGSSGEHQDFPGTVSIGTEALAHTLIELGRSARQWAKRIVFVNAHGGNVDALTTAVGTLREEGTDAAWHPCRHGDVHAGRIETSLMLRLDPQRVRQDLLAPGVVAPLDDLLPRLRAEGVRAVSDSGVLGDPTHATAAEGAAVYVRMAREIADAVRG